MKIELQPGQKVYFVSDAHFGLPNHAKSLAREKLMVQWLDEIRDSAAAIFLVGDIFDFWWEYKRVVPRNFVRLLGKLADISDAGIPVHMFWGNHDMWCKHNYFTEEIGAIVHPDELKIEIGNKQFYMAHGDGLGPGDKTYKVLKWAFRSRFLQWAFSQLHPDAGQALGQAWSSHRKYEHLDVNTFYREEEFLFKHAEEVLQTSHFDYFVFGHRHTPVVMPLNDKSYFVNTGDWLQHFTFGEFDGDAFELYQYPTRKNMNNYSLLTVSERGSRQPEHEWK